MTTNRLAKSEVSHIIPPSDPKEREKFWIERGNRILWGQEPTTKGDYLTPRLELEWCCKDGHYFIAPRGAKYREF